MSKKLSIIIVTYNSTKLIVECLDSIVKHNDLGDALEVIIVDNNSADQEELAAIIAQYKNLDILYLPTNKNGGYGAGNNVGVAQAKAPHILIMNPDVRIENPVFKTILDEFEANPKLAMTGVTFSDNSLPLYFKPEYYTVCKVLPVRFLVKYNLLRPHQTFLQGSFLTFDKEAFLQAGGFDENIFLYFEEPDITNRLLEIGKETKLLADIQVLHLTHDRKFNPFLVGVEVDSLNYYITKFKLNRKKVVRQYMLVNKIKYWISCIINNQAKKEEFKAWVDALKER